MSIDELVEADAALAVLEEEEAEMALLTSRTLGQLAEGFARSSQ